MYGRPNAISGAESLNALTACGYAPSVIPRFCTPVPKSMERFLVSSASDASGPKPCVRSVRSLLAPGLRMIVRRPATVGLASRSSGWSWSRKGLRRFATGFDASTSGVRSFRAARRFTNVVFERRMKSGKR